MANILPREKQLLCLKLLCEGNSIRGVERITSVNRDTLMRYTLRFGAACQQFLDTTIRQVNAQHLELDELWTFVGKKQRKCSLDDQAAGDVGDQYLFLAFDQATGLIACHDIGKRTEETTRRFIAKLAARIVLPSNVNDPAEIKPQISTDGMNAYPNAVLDVFGDYVQHGVIIKNYANPEVGRYAPPDLSNCERRCIQFVENLWSICTSHVERFNGTTRLFVKRFSRLTLAFSKRLANLEAAVAMHIAAYNFTWRSRYKNGPDAGRKRPTPAMQAGLTDRLWSFEDLYDAVTGM